ncbi:MAG TPA: IS1595 family transposase [Candidatus Scalindua sp.]|nr:IS1595 family transposase [Candidatus Scalindua sp.]
MSYTIKEFQENFADDDACLEYIFKAKFSDFVCKCGRSKFYRVKGRKAYVCSCGYQISPLTGTIFYKSSTSLTNWLVFS